MGNTYVRQIITPFAVVRKGNRGVWFLFELDPSPAIRVVSDIPPGPTASH